MPNIPLPRDPRELTAGGLQIFKMESIHRGNYLSWGAVYKAILEQPPKKKIIIAETLSSEDKSTDGKIIQIPPGYKCKRATVGFAYHTKEESYSHVLILLGTKFVFLANGPQGLPSGTLSLNDETEQFPLTWTSGYNGFVGTIEIECELTDEAYDAWRIDTYNAIVDAYEQMKASAEAKMADFDPNTPALAPAKKMQTIRNEIKKETIRKMFQCNPFWVNDNYKVGQEYDPNCCLDRSNAHKVRFLESTFDWGNMTYELHPYFYNNKSNWAQLLDLSDDDPHFEAFLQSSFATVRVPVFRDELKEKAAINFLANNSIGNYEVVPEDMEHIIEELSNSEPTKFYFDEHGNELPEPSEIVDLGIFPLPTDLVILECGNTDGIKPIGFPQSDDEPSSDVLLPKQYSPAIIADSCTPEANS